MDKARLSVKKQNFVERGGFWSIQNELLVSVYYLAREISPTIEQSDALKFHDISSHAKVYLCNLLARISPKFGRSHYFHGSRRVLFFNELFFNVLPCKIYTPVAKGMKIKISKSGRIFMVHLELIFGSISHDRRRIKSPFLKIVNR